jgi:predicted nucleic acid-binding Zn ribbon protein
MNLGDVCVCCGRYVPEGRQICSICEHEADDFIVMNQKPKRFAFIKKLLAFLLCIVVCFAFSACSSNNVKGSSDIAELEETENIDNVVVDIKTPDGTYYSTFSNVKINYYNGNISYISIDNSAILAFNISDNYDGGIYIIQGKDFDKIKENINAAKVALDEEDIATAQDCFEEAFNLTEQYYVYDYCPT